MKTTLSTLRDLRYQLTEMIEKEAMNLSRLARKAQEHGVREEVVREIREEAWRLRENAKAYPERILNWDFEYKTKYAFR